MHKVIIAVFLISLGLVQAGRQQIGQFYWVEWELETSKITIQVEAQTRGYVGFAFARRPDVSLMNEADIIICGVSDDNGASYLTDRHGVNNEVPVVDSSQDYTLLEASQNSTHTRVKFSRALQTGDAINDVDIILGGQTVLWSFGETDAHVYHEGINRGSSNINWVN